MISSLLFAATLVLPALPSPDCDDTEVVTNVSLLAVCPESRRFSFRLALDAMPSNNVSLAFGKDANMDGTLSRAEESLIIGWDCGVWKVVDCVTGDEIAEQGSPGPKVLEWLLLAVPGDSPRSLEVSVAGVPAFAALCANRPRFLFNAEWDLVKIVCRGLDAPNPQIEYSMKNTPMKIRIR